MWPPHSFSPPFPFLLLAAVPALSALIDTTFDDTSFTYSPDWNAISPSAPCGWSRVHGGTYHDGNCVSDKTSSGSAVSIYGIDQANTQPNIVFTVEGARAVHRYTGTERFVYDALFFSAKGLAADKTHTVNWVFDFEESSGVGVQAALFDYAVVTSGKEDDPDTGQDNPPPPPPPPQGPSEGDTGPGFDSPGDDPNKSTPAKSSSSSRKAKPSTSSRSHSSGSSPNPTVTPPNGISGTTDGTPPDQTNGQSESSQESPPAGAHPRRNIGAIVGGVIGALCVVVIAAIAYMFWRRKLRPTPSPVNPFIHEVPGPAVSVAGATTDVALSVSGVPSRFSDRLVGSSPTETLLSPKAYESSDTEPLNSPAASQVLDALTTTREQVLEQRVAQLEARIAAQLPPAYER
ncbi:hypothetical protein C8J57DRAFT_1341446 [Mycena rebaudengoi]|nr:hypothetical protein C8J57DRAFT_1341446 [Mycena rebaudengoi]